MLQKLHKCFIYLGNKGQVIVILYIKRFLSKAFVEARDAGGPVTYPYTPNSVYACALYVQRCPTPTASLACRYEVRGRLPSGDRYHGAEQYYRYVYMGVCAPGWGGWRTNRDREGDGINLKMSEKSCLEMLDGKLFVFRLLQAA